jgi:hypothetical protein
VTLLRKHIRAYFMKWFTFKADTVGKNESCNLIMPCVDELVIDESSERSAEE